MICDNCHGVISMTAPRVEMFGKRFCDRGCRDVFVEENTKDVNA